MGSHSAYMIEQRGQQQRRHCSHMIEQQGQQQRDGQSQLSFPCEERCSHSHRV